MSSHIGFGGIVDTSSSYFEQNRHSMYTQQIGNGSVPEWCLNCRCRYRHHTNMCHKYHVKHTSKQCNPDRLKSGLKRDTNETAICAVPAAQAQHRLSVHTLHRRTLVGEGRRGVQPRLFCLLCQGVRQLGVCGFYWRGLSEFGGSLYLYRLPRRSSVARPRQAVYSQNRNGYGVQGCGQGGGGSEVRLHVRVL